MRLLILKTIKFYSPRAGLRCSLRAKDMCHAVTTLKNKIGAASSSRTYFQNCIFS